MTISMTGFATAKGQAHGFSWVWDLRSVNGKGLDLRLRVPDWIDGLEQAVRAELTKVLSRGNVSLTLKLTRDDTGFAGLRVNRPALDAALAALADVQFAAQTLGMTLAPPSPTDVLTLRGVTDPGSQDDDPAPLMRALVAGLPGLIAACTAMRAAEGAALAGIISAQIGQIARLTEDAAGMAAARHEQAQTQLRAALARVMDASDTVDQNRLVQELALIAVKSDVTEEIDRLTAHVAAARALLAEAGPVGRKLDFLMQEFMREANTLCAKAQSIALTRVGLDLKTVIDQMREQVQNVE